MTGPDVSRAGSLPLVGGALALDFCNSASGRGTPGRQEHLLQPGDVLAWARHAGITDAEGDAALRRLLEEEPGFGPRLLASALALRDAIYRLDAALASDAAADQADIDAVAALHAACLARGRLTTREGAFGWSWSVADAPEAVVLGPIAASAMMVLTAADKARLKQCSGHHCGWLFLDTTKNNSRRWCEMEVCGNRAKQSRQRTRKRGEA